MNRPGFGEGVALALLAAVAGSIAFEIGAMFLNAPARFALLAGGLATAYAAYLLYRSPHRVGCIAVPAAWLVLCLALAVWYPPPPTILAVYLAALWLLRSAYHHSSLGAVVADLALQAAGIAAAFWAYRHSGSVFLAVWSYFLVQALFTAIPGSKPAESFDGDAFAQAHRNAEAALSRIAIQR